MGLSQGCNEINLKFLYSATQKKKIVVSYKSIPYNAAHWEGKERQK